ncbi:twin-arginine translocase TatA/TatE family subunit [Candidatus Acetothermia bacterium]|nr:twin-arginine translocase TatA/TatE family subunit [Candidatus Acetothermia bacterium]MBI3459816.1 twin-arginine translocase TatA/TatE family subunit [Candidatus Acetothermia bacterium]MBI3661380.1 twin-arginine translocase TatA/TatE family subunit [Candidatus Acetothermia bacterium]
MKWLLLIAVIGFILFYTRKMPQFARTIGSSVRAFREGKSESDPQKSKEESTKVSPR